MAKCNNCGNNIKFLISTKGVGTIRFAYDKKGLTSPSMTRIDEVHNNNIELECCQCNSRDIAHDIYDIEAAFGMFGFNVHHLPKTAKSQ